jgi:hypothetical protein
MFIPNNTGTYKVQLGYDLYGRATYGQAKPVRIGIVRLEQDSDPSTVRADSSASRGTATETTITARILVPADVQLKEGDLLFFSAFSMTVQSVRPRHAMSGKLDHWQLDLTSWADPDQEAEGLDL